MSRAQIAIWIIPTMMAVSLMGACKLIKKSQSATQFLNNGGSMVYPCHQYGKARIDEVKQIIPAGTVNGFSSQDTERVYNQLAGVPNLYLQYIASLRQQGKFSGGFQAYQGPATGSTGVTGNTNTTMVTAENITGEEPNYSATDPNFMDHSFIHEFGHCLDWAIRVIATQKNIGYNTGIQDAMTEFSAKGDLVRDYDKNNFKEAWADLFQHYYCSEDSYNFMKTNLPKSFAFLQTLLEPPVWASETSGGSANAAATNESSPTASGDTATTVSAAGTSSSSSGAGTSCPENQYCNSGWGWLNDGEGGCSSSSSTWKGNGCSCRCDGVSMQYNR